MRSASFLRETELALINAPFEEDGWARAAAMVAAATHSPTANLVGLGGPTLMPFNIFTGADNARFKRYFSRPELWGACNWRVGSTTVPMAIQHEGHYRAYRALTDTADYDDAVSDLDAAYGCQSALMMGQGGFVGLAMMRGRRDGPCSERTLAIFGALAVITNRAIRMQLAIDGEAAELMLGDLEHVTTATLLLDRHGNVSAMTRAAEDLFEADGALDLDGLAPRLRRRDEQRFLAGALTRILACDPAEAPLHQMRIGRDAAHPAGRWSLFVMRLPARDHGLGFDPHVALTIKPVAATIGGDRRLGLTAN